MTARTTARSPGRITVNGHAGTDVGSARNYRVTYNYTFYFSGCSCHDARGATGLSEAE